MTAPLPERASRGPLRPSGDRRLLATAGLLLMVLVALGLRGWGIGYGLPHPKCRPDEEQIVGRAVRMLTTGDIDPGELNYPGLFKHTAALALMQAYWAGRATGQYERLGDFLFDVKVAHPGRAYLISRAVTALMGVATVLLTFLLARGLTRDGRVGLLAAAFLATAYLHVRDSHYATVDVPMTFFIVLSLHFAVACGPRCALRPLVLAGVAAGLAAATKYNGGIVLVGALTVCVPALLRHDPDQGRRGILLRLLAVVGASAVAFVAAAPYTVRNLTLLVSELRRVGEVLTGMEGPPALFVHPVVTLPGGLGWPIFLLSLAGLVRAFRTRRGGHLAIAVFVVTWFASIARPTWVLPRYVVPLIPPLCVLAAEALVALAAALRRPWIILPLGVACALPGTLRSVEYDRLAARKDTRVLAAEWVTREIPSGTEVGICTGYGSISLPTRRLQHPRFRVRWLHCATADLASTDVPYLVTHEHPVLPWSPPVGHYREPLRQDWRERVAFDPFLAGHATGSVYFKGDAFYLPFTGLDTVQRGGPLVRIWERRTDRHQRPSGR